MAQCTNCRLDLTLYPPLASDAGPVCPNCGSPVQAATRGSAPETTGSQPYSGPFLRSGPGSSVAVIKRFWHTIWSVTLAPVKFFSAEGDRLVADGGVSSALAFAIVVQWLASFFNFVWRSVVGAAMATRLSDLSQIFTDVFQQAGQSTETLEQLREKIVDFLFGAGTVVLTPFTTLLKLVIAAAFIHMAVRFFMKDSPGRPQSYSTTLKVLCYASAPWVLCVIPFLGIPLAWVLAFFAAVIGLREVYRTSTARAVVAVLFPQLLFATFIFAAVVLFLFLAFNVLRLVF